MSSKLKKLLFNINAMLLEMKHDVKPMEIQKMDDSELRNSHTELHSLWTTIKKEKIENWDKSKIIKLHNQVIKEYSKRNLDHYYLSDLDDTLTSDLKNKTKTHSSENKDDS